MDAKYVPAPFDTDVEYAKEEYDRKIDEAVDKCVKKSSTLPDSEGEAKTHLYEIAERVSTVNLDALIDYLTAVYDARSTTSRPIDHDV